MEVLVKGVLAAYATLSLGVVWLLWRNAGAPDALKNAGIAAASLVTLAVAVLPYLVAQEYEKHYLVVLFRDAVEKRVTFGRLVRENQYQPNYLSMMPTEATSLWYRTPDTGLLLGHAGLDIVETGILRKLEQRFFIQHWDIRMGPELEGPARRSRRMTPGSAPKGTQLTIRDLRQLFRHNRIITTPNSLESGAFRTLTLPPASRLTATAEGDTSRRITITNPYVTLSIDIVSEGGGVLDEDVPWVLELDPANKYRYAAVHYRVSVKMKTNPLNGHAPEQAEYKRWYENVSDALEEFDWRRIKGKLGVPWPH